MSLLVVGSVAFDGIETPFGKVEKTLGGARFQHVEIPGLKELQAENESAQHKESEHPAPVGSERHLHVVKNYEQHGDRAQSVERRNRFSGEALGQSALESSIASIG